MTASIPDFSDASLFPSFADCPLIDDPKGNTEDYWLMGTIQNNMTLTPRTPTFICQDREGDGYAVTLKLKPGQDGEGSGSLKGEDNFYESKRGKKAFKRGHMIIVKGARRKGSREENAEKGEKEKKGFVEGAWSTKEGEDGIIVIPGTLDTIAKLSREIIGAGITKTCQGCGKAEEESVKLVRCKACESMLYCGEECQVKGWEAGHKGQCKILKYMKELFSELPSV